MSKAVKAYLDQHPVITSLLKEGLINITSLAEFIKKNDSDIESFVTVSAIAMAIRRYCSKLSKDGASREWSQDFQLHLITRSNLVELIFSKTDEKRQFGQALFRTISQTKHFSCLVEGEKEIVLITDFPLENLSNKKELSLMTSHQTQDLGFISIDLPISLREVVGVYSRITTVLAVAEIPIHSFHTLGGEVLILVKNRDLIRAQDVLGSLREKI